MGTNMVGGMVVAGPDGFEKNSYRKFNIKDDDLEPGDDYGMMREVMRRRFGRLKKEWEELERSCLHRRSRGRWRLTRRVRRRRGALNLTLNVRPPPSRRCARATSPSAAH